MTDWEQEAKRLERELKELNQTFNDFQATSEEVEAELDLALNEVLSTHNLYQHS